MADRQHDSRHPFQLLPVSGLAVLGFIQTVFGPEGSNVVLSVPHWSQRLFAALLLVSSLMVLWSTLRRGVRYARLERNGLLLLATVLGFYTLNIPEASTVTRGSFGWIFAFLGAAAVLRAGWVWRRIRHYPRAVQ